MKKQVFYLFLSVLILSLKLNAQENNLSKEAHTTATVTTALFIQDIPTLLKERNENIQASQMNVSSQEQRVGHLSRSFFPKVSAGIGKESFQIMPQDSQQELYWSIGAALNLYRGGRDKIEEEIRKGALNIAKMEVVQEYARALKQAQIGFWEGLAYQKLIDVRKEELKNNKENLKGTRRRSKSGISTKSDSVQLELNQVELEQSIEELKLSLDMVRTRLSVMLGIKNHKKVVFKGEFKTINFSNLKSLNPKEQIDVKKLLAQERVYSSKSKQANRWWHPTLDVYAEYRTPPLDDEYERALGGNEEVVAGIRLGFNLSNGLNSAADAKADLYAAKSNALKSAMRVREVNALEHELRHDMKVTSKLIKKNDEILKMAEKFLRLTQDEYIRGLKSGLDLLSASQQYFKVQDKAILLRKNLNIAKVELDNLTVNKVL